MATRTLGHPSQGSALIAIMCLIGIVGILAGVLSTFASNATKEATLVRRATLAEAIRDYLEKSVDCTATIAQAAGCTPSAPVSLLNSAGGTVVEKTGRKIGAGEARAFCASTPGHFRVEYRWPKSQDWSSLYGDLGLSCL